MHRMHMHMHMELQSIAWKRAASSPEAAAERIAREPGPHRVQRMQRSAAALRVPPVARQLLELGHLCGVQGGAGGARFLRSPAADRELGALCTVLPWVATLLVPVWLGQDT